MISGATATEAGCRALPDGLWVSAAGGERHECLRFAAAGVERPARIAVAYIPGDPGGVAYRFAGGRPYVERVSEYYELSPETRRAGVEALSGAMGGELSSICLKFKQRPYTLSGFPASCGCANRRG